MFFSRFAAQRKVSCIHRAWRAPMGMCAAGGWGPGMRSFVSSTPPASNLCSLLQVHMPLATACVLLRSLLPPAGGVDPGADTRGCLCLIWTPHLPSLWSRLLLPRVCLCDIFCMAMAGHIYVSTCALVTAGICSHLGSNRDGLSHVWG